MALLAVQACGSDDDKKRSQAPAEAGAGGEATEPGAGGSAAGQPPIGMAGEPTVSEGGGAGSGGTGEVAGAGGEPSFPEPELLFTVKPGGVGLSGTAVRDADNVQNVIYTSGTGSQEAINGTNAAKVTGAELGLAPTDQIVAFALPQPEPQNPQFLFSVADGSEGYYSTRVNADYYEDVEESHLYYSDGVSSDRNVGGLATMGYNGLLATQSSLGLSPGAESPPDDLSGLMARDAREPITEIYFAVLPAAEGVEGSAVAETLADDRGCTLFKSTLDGTNTVAFTCAELGLATFDQLDGLAIFNGAEPSVLFSVTRDAEGGTGTDVADVSYNNFYDVGGTIFRSIGDGDNSVYVNAIQLGLGEFKPDDVDGFSVVDAALPVVEYAESCELPDFYAAEPGLDLYLFRGSSYIAPNILLVYGLLIDNTARVAAIDATTCAELQRQDLPLEFASPSGTALIPQAGWSALTPLDNVEYQRLTDDDEGTGKVLRRYDALGQFQNAVPVSGLAVGTVVSQLVYEPVHDRLFTIFAGLGPQSIGVMPRPTPQTQLVDVSVFETTFPCGGGSDISGTDALGNLYLAEPQNDGTLYRVCAFTPSGELFPAPYFWQSDGGSDTGFMVPGGSHFNLYFPDGPGAFLDRSDFKAP